MVDGEDDLTTCSCADCGPPTCSTTPGLRELAEAGRLRLATTAVIYVAILTAVSSTSTLIPQVEYDLDKAVFSKARVASGSIVTSQNRC